MRRLILMSALAAALAGPAGAQTLVDTPPGTAGEAAGITLHEFCLPQFDAEGRSPDRVAALAASVGLNDAMGEWVAPSPAGTTVTAAWIEENGVCRVTVTGPAGAGADLLDAMDGIGWTPMQRGVQASEDIMVDVWTGQPQGIPQPVMIAANRWVSDAEPEGGVRLMLNMLLSSAE